MNVPGFGGIVRWISRAEYGGIEPRHLDFINDKEEDSTGNSGNNDISSTDGIRGSIMSVNLSIDGPTPDGGTDVSAIRSVGLTPGSDELTRTEGNVTLESVLRERDELIRQREEMKMRFANKMMEDQEKWNYDCNKVRIGGRRPVYTGVDAANYTKVTALATKIFHNSKMLPEDWHKYSLVANSVCDRILKSGITVPYEYSTEFYFCNVLRKQFMCKYRSMKTNFTTVWREEFMGERPELYICMHRTFLTLGLGARKDDMVWVDNVWKRLLGEGEQGKFFFKTINDSNDIKYHEMVSDLYEMTMHVAVHLYTKVRISISYV